MPIYSVTTETEEAVSTTVETILQLRGATTCVAEILGFGISFDGVTAAAEPVRVRLLRQTTDGTGTASSEVAWDPNSGVTAGCAALTAFSSTEPTAGDVLLEQHVHPQGGYWNVMFPLGERPMLDNVNTSRIALDVLAPAAVNVCAWMIWKE